MGNDLREQLLKAGLVTKGQVREAEAFVRKKSKQARHGGKPSPQEAARQKSLQARTAKAERDRELNRRKEEARQKKALRAQVRSFLDDHRRNDPKGETAFNFAIGGRVKHVYVNTEQLTALTGGRLVVASVFNRQHILSPEDGERLRKLMPEAAIFVAEDKPEEPAEDDPYAEYKIPDDLMW